MEIFVETNVVIDILEILKDSHCALLIGVSGMGKTLTAQNVALRLWHEKEYSIVPCSSLNDIQTRYRENVNQVFFVDDICGRYTTNIMKIENWMNIEEFVKCILGKGKTKILATCRTEVFLEEIFQDTFEIFKDDEEKYNKRIKMDLENGKIHCCLNNAQMKYKEYRIKFRDILRNLENNLMTNLINIDGDGRTPLHAACYFGNNDIVSILISNDLDVNMLDVDFETPLHKACRNGSIRVIQTLLNYGADVHKLNKEEHTPIYLANTEKCLLVAACQQGHGFLIQLLLEEGADIYQALVCAVLKDCDRAVKILLHKGGDLNYKSVDGKSLIKLACEYGSIKAIKILSDKGADFTEIDVNGRTLIHVACNTNSVELLQFLIDKEKGCSIAILEEDTKSALLSVFMSGNTELSKLLISNGYIDKLSHFNEMIYHAQRYKKTEILRIHGIYGTDIKKRYKYGYTPMILADIGGNDDLSENLQNRRIYKIRRAANILLGVLAFQTKE
ncbi:ANKRD28 [Mytilus edulis]|uniref:ANKRD28 n=1 Tax=Mytilus edulis TaxID=6550 RepID=A0A8S3Q843_MYTED|nr:ANKRD28 [Mytilus edulis]